MGCWIYKPLELVMSFVEKYRPKSLSQIKGQADALRKLLFYVRKKPKKAVILYGGVGVGKTSAVYALASDFNLEIIELNASDSRNKDSISSIIKNNLQLDIDFTTLFNQQILSLSLLST